VSDFDGSLHPRDSYFPYHDQKQFDERLSNMGFLQSGLTMSASRREVVQAGAGVAAVAPFLGAAQANAARTMPAKVIFAQLIQFSMNRAELVELEFLFAGMMQEVAPVITIFDHRGCDRPTLEYQGAKANGPDDYMCVKVKAEVSKRIVPEAHVSVTLHLAHSSFETVQYITCCALYDSFPEVLMLFA
jgi:hypothetical protein